MEQADDRDFLVQAGIDCGPLASNRDTSRWPTPAIMLLVALLLVEAFNGGR